VRGAELLAAWATWFNDRVRSVLEPPPVGEPGTLLGAGWEGPRSASGRSARRAAAVALLSTVLLACSRIDSAAGPRHLHLTHIRPSNPEGLFLNEELVFHFDEDLDPTSVTGASVEIRAEDGRRARGELHLESDRVRFVPAAVLASDLSDGGYLPGTRYTVTLPGFPRPEGLRSSSGLFLERTWTWTFRTVDVRSPRTGLVFEDRMQDRVGLLRLFPAAGGQVALIRAQDSIYLACDKPIDPSTLRAEAFRLTHLPPTYGSPPPQTPETVALRVRLLENESVVARRSKPALAHSSAAPEAWERDRRACLIEATPERPLAGGAWEIRISPDALASTELLRDFGGKPVLIADPSGAFRISVDNPSAEAALGEWTEEFENAQLFSPVAIPGYDGTAAWNESGRVEVRYPAAAGSGEAGDVRLEAKEDRRDVQATSIDLPAKAACRLRPDRGLAVLRCQGRMTIAGALGREAPWDPSASDDPTPEAWEKLCKLKVVGPQTLSGWLADVAAADRTWTVLIAGGDLEITGSVSVSTPLLLVAGGRIRISGPVQGVSRQVPTDSGSTALNCVFLLGEGGGLEVTPPASYAPIVLDEPQGANPLRKQLRFAALSGPIPPLGEVLRWRPPDATGSPSTGRIPTCGKWSVRYTKELPTVPKDPSDLALADTPAQLLPAGPIRFLIVLDVDPGGVWSPPWVDSVHLSWEQPPPRENATPADR
jgi:hypothetical protein